MKLLNLSINGCKRAAMSLNVSDNYGSGFSDESDTKIINSTAPDEL